MPTAISIAIGMAIGIATPVRAQQIATAAREMRDIDTAGMLSRPVTVSLRDVPLEQAILAVASSAHVQLQYRSALVNKITTTVTLQVTRVPLGRVLPKLLNGTQLEAVPIGRDLFSIEPASGTSQRTGGGVSGIVIDAASRKPVGGATVMLDDSVRVVQTRENGTFLLSGLRPGVHKLTVRRIGYRVYSVPVTVTDEATTTVSVQLIVSAAVLNEVVTTATGDRRRLEVGNAVGTIKADSIVPTTLIRNVSDLLQARVPGVVVSNTDGAVGAPSRIRLRGVNSLALNNDPIIILDGVRLNAQATAASIQTNVGSQNMLPQAAIGIGGNRTAPLAPSRLDDIDPNTIESIDILRGPSASSLYGTDAANGVIVIKTKKGHAGSWRSTISGDVGQSNTPGKMPEMWWGWGHYNYALQSTGCNLAIGGIATVMGGGCVQDSVTQFNPQNNAAMRTLGTGSSRTLSGTISGGNESLQQFFSMRAADVVGMSKMSGAEQRLIARVWNSPAPSWMVHPNTEQDLDGSSRTTFNVSPKADVSLTTDAIYRNVLNGGAGQAVSTGSGASPADTLSYLPSESQRTKVTSASKRGTLSGVANYRPWSWMSFNATGGGDFGLREDEADLRAQDCSIALQLANTGSTACPSAHTTSRGQTFVTTANVGGQLSFAPRSWLELRTSFGEQYSHTNFYSLQVGNSDPTTCPLAFGTTLLTPIPACADPSFQQYAVAESRDEAATAGIYLEETINLFGLYNTFGIRRDVASAFGGLVTKSPPNYPKFNFSYPLSEKSFFPKQPYVSSLRLRLAYGQSGNQASRTGVLNGYALTQNAFPAGVLPSVVVTQLGNPDLRPERGTEWEGGFDVSFLETERLRAEVTLYRKFTRDAITALTLAPSYGADNLTQFFNLGNVQNRGVELSLDARVFDSRLFGWDLALKYSRNANKLVRKSPSLNVNGPLNTQFREGYPVFGYWGAPVLSYADLDGNGILSQSEITFGPQQFMGAPYPKSELTYNSNLSLWNGALRVTANLEQVRGATTQLLVNDAGSFYPRAAVDRTTPLAQQAAFIQAVVNNNAYIGTSSSVRLNELSVTYTVPVRMARQLFHVQSLAITAAGRNLALWSNYAGKDPNVDTSGLFGDATQDNALGTPQPRDLALRFNLGL